MADLQFMVEDTKLIFRNFAGAENMYNAQGSRNFAVVLEPEVAEQMAADGWNVKFPEARIEDEEEIARDPYISVEVSYKNRPPLVVMISSTARTNLNEDSVELLDWADIEKADIIANAYRWTVNGKSGIKAYLKTLFVTINEDELERKYNAMGDSE